MQIRGASRADGRSGCLAGDERRVRVLTLVALAMAAIAQRAATRVAQHSQGFSIDRTAASRRHCPLRARTLARAVLDAERGASPPVMMSCCCSAWRLPNGDRQAQRDPSAGYCASAASGGLRGL